MFEEYKAFKEKVGVDDVAAYLGYKLDRKAGVGKYVEYNIRDGRGRKIDSIVISHPAKQKCLLPSCRSLPVMTLSLPRPRTGIGT